MIFFLSAQGKLEVLYPAIHQAGRIGESLGQTEPGKDGQQSPDYIFCRQAHRFSSPADTSFLLLVLVCPAHLIFSRLGSGFGAPVGRHGQTRKFIVDLLARNLQQFRGQFGIALRAIRKDDIYDLYALGQVPAVPVTFVGLARQAETILTRY